MKQFIVICFSFVLFLFSVRSILAQVKINEFLIDPQPQQVELINTSTESADISHWFIDDNGGTTYFTVPQNTILPPLSCAVFSSDFSLNKLSADVIRLFNKDAPPTSSSAVLIDSFSYKTSPGTNISYMRIPDSSIIWASGPATLGLWNSTSLSCIFIPTPTPTNYPAEIIPISSRAITSTPSSAIEHIYISEVMVNPKTGEKEWIELYNDNNYPITLSSWLIDDAENAGSKPVLFSATLGPYGFAVIELSSSLFNNDGDEVRLLNNLFIEKDSFQYDSSEKGQSFNRVRFETNEFCIEDATKGTENNECTPPRATVIISSSTPIPTPPIMSFFIPKSPVLKKSSILLTPTISYTTPRKQTEPIESGEILGISTNSAIPHRREIKSLSFSSLSFGVLTIVSIFLKMKMRL